MRNVKTVNLGPANNYDIFCQQSQAGVHQVNNRCWLFVSRCSHNTGVLRVLAFQRGTKGVVVAVIIVVAVKIVVGVASSPFGSTRPFITSLHAEALSFSDSLLLYNYGSSIEVLTKARTPCRHKLPSASLADTYCLASPYTGGYLFHRRVRLHPAGKTARDIPYRQKLTLFGSSMRACVARVPIHRWVSLPPPECGFTHTEISPASE